jgi:hypothetical protein
LGTRGYFLIAEVEADGVAATWPTGAQRSSRRLLPFDEVTELIVTHLRLHNESRSVPVGLAVSGDPSGQQTLARMIANRTGRLVYTNAAGLTVSPPDANGTAYLIPAGTAYGAPSTIIWERTEPHRPDFQSIPQPSGTGPGGTGVLTLSGKRTPSIRS